MNEDPGMFQSWQQAVPILIAGAFVWAIVIGSAILALTAWAGL